MRFTTFATCNFFTNLFSKRISTWPARTPFGFQISNRVGRWPVQCISFPISLLCSLHKTQTLTVTIKKNNLLRCFSRFTFYSNNTVQLLTSLLLPVFVVLQTETISSFAFISTESFYFNLLARRRCFSIRERCASCRCFTFCWRYFFLVHDTD